MGRLLRPHKGKVDAQNVNFPIRRQSLCLNLIKINTKRNWNVVSARRLQKTNPPCLDHASQGRWATGPKLPPFQNHLGLVIRHQLCPISHQLKRQPRLARARSTANQDTFSVNGHCRGMQQPTHQRADQTGRPTTKRAPSGSDPASAWVGRMFSAQITPPCASTICFEIERPRPELLPKSFLGRSE